MNFPDAIKSCLENYVTFSGRARRAEYWYWVLFTFVTGVILGIVDGILGVEVLGTLFSLATLLPGIAVAVRRMHDTDRSGWWVLINIIPIVGWIIFIIWAATKGTAGDNRFGPDPVV